MQSAGKGEESMESGMDAESMRYVGHFHERGFIRQKLGELE